MCEPVISSVIMIGGYAAPGVLCCKCKTFSFTSDIICFKCNSDLHVDRSRFVKWVFFCRCSSSFNALADSQFCGLCGNDLTTRKETCFNGLDETQIAQAKFFQCSLGKMQL